MSASAFRLLVAVAQLGFYFTKRIWEKTNEKEIDKYEDDIPKLKTDNVTKKDSDNTAYDSNQLNNRKSKYQRTKEKLIGLTILYNIPIRESFDEIIKEYITNKQPTSN